MGSPDTQVIAVSAVTLVYRDIADTQASRDILDIQDIVERVVSPDTQV